MREWRSDHLAALSKPDSCHQTNDRGRKSGEYRVRGHPGDSWSGRADLGLVVTQEHGGQLVPLDLARARRLLHRVRRVLLPHPEQPQAKASAAEFALAPPGNQAQIAAVDQQPPVLALHRSHHRGEGQATVLALPGEVQARIALAPTRLQRGPKKLVRLYQGLSGDL